jgi:hypothetical protein
VPEAWIGLEAAAATSSRCCCSQQQQLLAGAMLRPSLACCASQHTITSMLQLSEERSLSSTASFKSCFKCPALQSLNSPVDMQVLPATKKELQPTRAVGSCSHTGAWVGSCQSDHLVLC